MGKDDPSKLARLELGIGLRKTGDPSNVGGSVVWAALASGQSVQELCAYVHSPLSVRSYKVEPDVGASGVPHPPVAVVVGHEWATQGVQSQRRE